MKNEENKKKKVNEKDLETMSGGCGKKTQVITVYCRKCNYETQWTVPAGCTFPVYEGPCPECKAPYLYHKR